MDTLTRREWLAVSAAAVFCPFGTAQDADPKDGRLGPPKTLNDYFPLTPPKYGTEWMKRRDRLRQQVKVALGLYPMPEFDIFERFKPTFVGKIERDGYTVENVSFPSLSAHDVTGSLYRPTGIKPGEKVPAVIFAHGHWAEGRFHIESDAAAKKLVDSKAEPDMETAKYFMQHMPAALAKMGIICLAIDMVGYADSTAIGHVAKSGVPHANGFATVDCELHLHSLLSLQIINCIRSIDFLESLSDVDPKRIGMTGASGGGTQTFLTAAIDERIAVAAPAVMVSTAMQGGCVCENCSLLRVGTGNVEIAALIAPRPLALTAANDWTKELMTNGYPELHAVYSLHGRTEKLTAKAWPEFPHNYNMPARKFVLEWFGKHFLNGKMPEDFEFKPVPVEKLRIGAPKFGNADMVHLLWRINDERALHKLAYEGVKLKDPPPLILPRRPVDSPPNDNMAPYPFKPQDRVALQIYVDEMAGWKDPERKVRAKALASLVVDELPEKIAVRKGPAESKVDGCTVHRAWFGRENEKDALPTIGMFGKAFTGEKVLLWLHPDGKETLFEKDKLVPPARTAIDAGYAVVSADLLGTGTLAFDKPRPVNPVYAGFTWGYNRTLLAERVHDILTLIAFAKTMLKAKTIHLVGWKAAGPWVALARQLARDSVSRCAVDLNQFSFAKVKDFNDPMMLPGALKYNLDDAFADGDKERPLLAHNAAAMRVEMDGRIVNAKPRDNADVMKWLLG